MRKFFGAAGSGNALMPPDRAGNPDMVERGFVGPTNMPKVVVEPAKQGVGPGGAIQRPSQAEKQQARENVDVDQAAQGLSGTANLAGFIEDIGEYDPKMKGLQAIQRYDKMRRTDAAVYAAESARRLPILAADWDIQPGANDPLSKEAAKLAKENLMGGLESETASGEKHTQTFENVLRNALLCDPYGCSAHEDLWAVDADKSQIRLRRLAPRLARTFYQFVTEPDGETLYQLIQFGYRGQMVEIVPVDAWKLCYFAMNSEGANFYGWSNNRTAYLPWYFKQQTMRIDAIGNERNRLAVPVIKQGPNASPQDVAQSWEWVENLSTNERTGLSLPYQWEAMLMGIEGRAIDLTNSIRFYDEQIFVATMTDFMSLGKTASGSRALGDVKLDFFLLAEEALARFIAKAIESTTVRRLVDHNFQTSQEFAYPKVICQNIPALNFMDMLTVVKDLASANVGMVETTEDRDNYIARKLGLPPISGTPRPKYAPIVRRIQEMDTGDQAIPDEDAPGGGKATPDTGISDGGKESQSATGKTQNVKPQPRAQMAEAPSRALTAIEKKHDFQGHVDRADTTGRQVKRVLKSGMAPYVKALASDAGRREVADVRNASAVVPHAMAARLEKVLSVAHRYGHDQVYAERRKATGRGKNVPAKLSAERSLECGSDAAALKAVAALPQSKAPAAQLLAEKANKKPVSFTVQATISDWENELTKRVFARTLDYMRDGIEGDQLVKKVADDITTGSDGWLSRLADEAARGAVAGGRDNAFRELGPEISSYVRSEVMDRNTCENCQAGDGHEWASYDDIDWQPGDDCDGGDACRGQIIPVFEDEGAVILE
jgi:hypothetical protein